MTSLAFWRKRHTDTDQAAETAAPPDPVPAQSIELDIAPNDPLLAYLQQHAGVVEPEKLQLDSPALRQMRAAGIELVIPLVSQGELIGLINLGTRRSEQAYSSDDRKLLQDLATQAAPAVRVAQLVQQQQAEARERERIEQELRVARLIQQTLLPQAVEAGMAYVPGAPFYAHEPDRRTLRLSFVTSTTAQIEQGMAALARVVRQAVS